MPSIKYKKKTYAGSTFPVLEMTKAQYDALSTAKKMDGTVYMITDDTGGWEAEDSVYDNAQSGLTATNVQSALDEIFGIASAHPVVREDVVVTIANDSLISKVAGMPYIIRLNGNRVLCFFSMRFKTTSQRAANLGVFGLRFDNKNVIPDEPYFIPCEIGGQMTFSYRNGVDERYFSNPVVWEANTEISFSAVFIGQLSNS